MEPAEVFRVAILKGATCIIGVHNHPSEGLEISQADKDITRDLLHAGRILGIELVDHIIITPTKYLSLGQSGLIDEINAGLDLYDEIFKKKTTKQNTPS